jgi:HK97 gp10 family phage protein
MKVRGLKALQNRITGASKSINNELDIAVKSGVLTARNTAIQQAPKDKGQLRQGINFRRLGKRHYELNSQMPYSIFQEFGTGFSINVPTNTSPQLRKVGLNYKYGSRLKSKGIRPKLFMTKAFWVAKSYVAERAFRIVNKKR